MQGFRKSASNEALTNLFILQLKLEEYHKRSRRLLLDVFSEADWADLATHFDRQNDKFEALSKLRPAFDDWIARYHALLDVIESNGYAVRPVEDYLVNGLQDRTIFVYHDVHAWDIVPALGMALANKERGVCTTFYLNVGHDPVDSEHAAGYRVLASLAGENVRVGLHASPFSSWLRQVVFKGDKAAFAAWIAGDSKVDDVRALLGEGHSALFDGVRVEDARAGTVAQLERNFGMLKQLAPTAISANHHGDEVSLVVREVPKNLSGGHEFLAPVKFLTTSDASRIGVQVSPGFVQKVRPPDGKIYAERPNRKLYLENLHDLMQSGRQLQLINHPGSISNGLVVCNLEFAKAVKDGVVPSDGTDDPVS